MSGTPLSCLQQSCPDPIFVPSNALDITVLTCYLDQYFYYNMNTEQDKGDVLYAGIASQKVRTFLYVSNLEKKLFSFICVRSCWRHESGCALSEPGGSTGNTGGESPSKTVLVGSAHCNFLVQGWALPHGGDLYCCCRDV